MAATELTSKDIRRKKASETRNVLVDFQNCLDKDDAIDETITLINGVSATGLSISGSTITTTARRINGRACQAGKAISFTVSGGTIDNDYDILAVVTTSGGQVIDRTLRLAVRGA